MGSKLRSKKGFLYFGGALVVILGGATILLAPYHYTGFIATPPDATPFSILNATGYYSQLEIAASVQPANVSSVSINFRIVNNNTLVTQFINMNLTQDDYLAGTNPKVFQKQVLVSLAPGNYVVYIDNMTSGGSFDFSLEQASDSRQFITTGASLNVVGIVMCIGGYCVPGTILPTGDETIVGWGYDKEEKQ
jgi:hypothetical protein